MRGVKMPYSLLTKTQNSWVSNISGELNKLNTNFLFETDNKFGFPEVSTSDNFIVEDLVGFHLSKKEIRTAHNKAVHFFLDDYKFEQIWTRPRDFVTLFQTYGGIISPTFSIWSNQPYALNIFNMYRSRWCARFYQEFGVKVLVDVRWSDESSYDFAFSGIKKNTPVIVNTVGTRYLENRKMFISGFYEMLRVLEPDKLYVYGEYMPIDFSKYFNEVIYFESFWKKQRDKIQSKSKEGM